MKIKKIVWSEIVTDEHRVLLASMPFDMSSMIVGPSQSCNIWKYNITRHDIYGMIETLYEGEAETMFEAANRCQEYYELLIRKIFMEEE